jgi:hypothetical protein
MKSVVPGWARPCEMIGKNAMEYKLHGVEGEPCLFKHVSPRDITQGGGVRNRFLWVSGFYGDTATVGTLIIFYLLIVYCNSYVYYNIL